MKCEISININGQKVVLGTADKPIADLSQLENLLKSSSFAEIDSVLNSIKTITSINQFDIENITENSLGVLTPRDLYNGIESEYIKNIIGTLKIPKSVLDKQCVIVGFGSENIKTGYINGHIFLNLNYLNDNYNKALALVEIKLFNYNPEEYLKNSEIMYSGTKEQRSSILNEILQESASKNSTIEGINFIFEEISRKKYEYSTANDLLNKRDSFLDTWNKYSEFLLLNKEISYLPHTYIPIKDVSQGDLISIKYGDRNVYEMFFDYKIEDDKVILTTISEIDGKPTTHKNTIDDNTNVAVRKFNSEEYNLKNISESNKIRVKVDKHFRYWNYDSLIQHIKENGVTIPITKGSTSGKSLQGNTLVLSNNTSMKIEEIKSIEVPLTLAPSITTTITQDNIDNTLWQENTGSIMNGDNFLFKQDSGDYVAAKVLITGKTKDNNIVFYITNINNKPEIGYINESNIKYVSTPPSQYVPSVIELQSVKEIVSNFFSTDPQTGAITENVKERFLNPKKNQQRAFAKTKFSLQEVDKTTPIRKDDFLYNKSTGRIFKVLKVNKGLVKSVINEGGSWKYITLNSNNLEDYLLLSDLPVNQSFAKTFILKNRYSLGIKDTLGDGTGIISEQINVYKDSTSGYVYANTKKFSENDIDITNEQKEVLNQRFQWGLNFNELKNKPLYRYKGINGAYLKDSYNTVPIDIRGYWPQVFKKIVPGSLIMFNGNADAFVVEKIIDNKMLISNYHYSEISNSDKSDFSKIRAEKFFIDRTDPNIQVQHLYMPYWADYNYKDIKKIIGSGELLNSTKNSYISQYSLSDSPEIIMEMVDLISKKFNININVINNEDLENFKDLGVENSAAFVYEGGVFINIDKASIEEPLHEVLHLVLSTMKAQNPDNYYKLVNSVEQHPKYPEISKNYEGFINSDILEEVFVKILSSTFRKNMLKDGVFSSELFSSSIKAAISEMFSLQTTMTWEDPFNLLERPISDLMQEFESDLVGKPDGVINFTDAFRMFEVSGKIRKMIKNNQLIQECNG